MTHLTGHRETRDRDSLAPPRLQAILAMEVSLEASCQATIPREHNQSEVLTLFAHKSAVQGGDPAQLMGLYWLHRDWHLE